MKEQLRQILTILGVLVVVGGIGALLLLKLDPPAKQDSSGANTASTVNSASESKPEFIVLRSGETRVLPTANVAVALEELTLSPCPTATNTNSTNIHAPERCPSRDGNIVLQITPQSSNSTDAASAQPERMTFTRIPSVQQSGVYTVHLIDAQEEQAQFLIQLRSASVDSQQE